MSPPYQMLCIYLNFPPLQCFGRDINDMLKNGGPNFVVVVDSQTLVCWIIHKSFLTVLYSRSTPERP